MSDDIIKAKELLEWLGYKVIPEENIKTASFHVAITDQEQEEGYAEEILKSYEKRKNAALEQQLKEFEAVRYTTRSEINPNVTIHSWKIKVIV